MLCSAWDILLFTPVNQRLRLSLDLLFVEAVAIGFVVAEIPKPLVPGKAERYGVTFVVFGHLRSFVTRSIKGNVPSAARTRSE